MNSGDPHKQSLPVLPNSGKVEQLRREMQENPPTPLPRAETDPAHAPAATANVPPEIRLLQGKVIEACRQVFDPEIPVNIYELGLIYAIDVQPDHTVEAAGGYMIQLLPGLSETEIAAIEQRIADLPHPPQLLRNGAPPEEILERIFPEGYTLGDSSPIRFHCPCSRERFEAAIVSLGQEEVQRIIAEEEEPFTEVVCHFCNESYQFSPVEMEAILEAAR